MNKRIIWALAGFIAVAILIALALSVGLLAPSYTTLPGAPKDAQVEEALENSMTVPVVSLASGIVAALYFYTLYPLYARRRRLAVYLSIFFIALALILPVILGTNIDPLLAIWTYYLPGALVTKLLLAPLLPYGLLSKPLGRFLTINISWVVWGLVGLGIGYLLEKPSKGRPKQ